MYGNICINSLLASIFLFFSCSVYIISELLTQIFLNFDMNCYMYVLEYTLEKSHHMLHLEMACTFVILDSRFL